MKQTGLIAIAVFVFSFAGQLVAQQTAEEYFQLALEQKRKGRYGEVIRLLDEAIRLNTNNVEALFERSEAKQNNQRDLDGAMEDLETILQLAPGNGKAYFHRARLRHSLVLRLLKKKGRTPSSELKPYFQEILDDVNSAISNGYENKDSYWYRADLLSRHFRRYTEAIEDYTAALLDAPMETGLYFNRSNAKRNNDDLKGAAEDLREIVLMYKDEAALPTNKNELKRLRRLATMALNGLSSIFGLLEQPDDQLWAIEGSLKIEPTPAGYAARGRHHMIFGNLNDAIADYDKAIELSKNDTRKGWYLMSRGIVHTLDGQTEKAEADFTEGRKLPRMDRYRLNYWLELSRRQRDQRRIKVKLPGS